MPKPLRALLIEDNSDDAILLLRELKRGGYNVESVCIETSSEMRSHLESATWDIIFCDFNLPQFSALAALEIAREVVPETPVIVVSGSVGEERAVDAMRAGAKDFILKASSSRLLPAVERELADASLQKTSRKQIQQLQKIDVLGRLASGIAHDYNNLLSAILINCELGLAKIKSNLEIKEIFDEILHVVERGTSLTRQLLIFSRKEQVRKSPLECNTLVEGLEKMLRRLIGAEIKLVILPSPHPIYVSGNVGQLEQVILNLVVNARDAVSGTGTIKIEITERENQAVILVHDTGIGMNAETRSKIFEPFFTTKAMGHGTGLGLTTSLDIISQHDGEITCQSKEGMGTTFQILLPIVASEAATVGAIKKKPIQTTTASETVLLVDDESTLRNTIAQTLLSHGYQVIKAANGLEALAILEQKKNHIDLLITDASMPELSGSELVRKITRAGNRIPVLFISGWADEVELKKIVDGLVPVSFLEKPFSTASLIESLRLLSEQNYARKKA
jgi:signal transduction histidine kinase